MFHLPQLKNDMTKDITRQLEHIRSNNLSASQKARWQCWHLKKGSLHISLETRASDALLWPKAELLVSVSTIDDTDRKII